MGMSPYLYPGGGRGIRPKLPPPLGSSTVDPAGNVGGRDVIRSVGRVGRGAPDGGGDSPSGRAILLTLKEVRGGGGIGGLMEDAGWRCAAAAVADAPLDAFFFLGGGAGRPAASCVGASALFLERGRRQTGLAPRAALNSCIRLDRVISRTLTMPLPPRRLFAPSHSNSSGPS